MARKKARPATATGTPAITDHWLGVTLRQFTVPLSEHASVVESVKCSYVR